MTASSSDITIRVPAARLNDDVFHRECIAREMKLSSLQGYRIILVRRSLDARGRDPFYALRYRVQHESASPSEKFALQLSNVAHGQPVVVVGMGPAGLFAAIRLIELGLKPVVIERGKAVRERRHDLAAITKRGHVDPDSNYCFGEGGAGTFSDGKLYTRSNKRGSIERVLQILVAHGADPEILVDAHPHIGTNKLPKVVEAMRETIKSCGGEVHFGTAIGELLLDAGKIRGAQRRDGGTIEAEVVILATGHSARDVFSMLMRQGVRLERKPFALGVRVEHPQGLIDELQYKSSSRSEFLPPASYSMVAQCEGRGVFSFCMCPGGIICPSATQNDEVVVNGWSPSSRNSRFANSGIVVEIEESDLQPFASDGVLAGVSLQRSIELSASHHGGGNQAAPAQRLTDFLRGRVSATLPDCSYIPGLKSADLREVFPPALHRRLQLGFEQFNVKRRGYVTDEAVVVAVESRTSSPVRIPRDSETRCHPDVRGLIPVGEGAGYAGGIVSAAMDGELGAEAAARLLGRAASTRDR